MALSRLFISKNRKVDFEVTLQVEDLTNVPLVSGLYYVKWRLKNTDHTSGSTSSQPIRDHSIIWGHRIITKAHLIISKHHVLGSCEFKMDVYQELGGHKDAIPIGGLTINLSEYANSGYITRRYLLNDCKFNSTVKLSIKMDQMSTTSTEYITPPLKKQQIFADIPSMITDRNDRLLLYEDKLMRLSNNSLAVSNDNSHTDSKSTHNTESISRTIYFPRKARSAVSLPYHCREVTAFHETDDPSPDDLIEQLFKANNIPTSSS
ncbi:N-terminal C2 in EEIG1 and EHBP1 proteins-domain-containing protein [Pilobolus umbonatus]|nr:N-terminal C2 in EEIG1 and EHBP1 proteins-domain-containing protein [Pilobolus umbonatus]